MNLLSALRDAREFLGLGRDITQLLLEIGRLIKGGNEGLREEVETIRNREAIAGKARYEASKNAGRHTGQQR